MKIQKSTIFVKKSFKIDIKIIAISQVNIEVMHM